MENLKVLSSRMVQDYRGKLDSPRMINSCLDDFREVTRLASEISSQLSFIDTEIASQKESVPEEAIAIATHNKCYLQDILRRKPHQLHPEAERAVAALSQTIQAPYQIYNMAKMADIRKIFPYDGRPLLRFPQGSVNTRM